MSERKTVRAGKVTLPNNTSGQAYRSPRPVECDGCGHIIAPLTLYTRAKRIGGGAATYPMCRLCRPFRERPAATRGRRAAMSEQHTIAMADTLKILARAFESGELPVPAALLAQGHDGLDLAIVLMLIARSLEDSRAGGVGR